MSTKKCIHLIYIFCDSSTHIDQQTNVRKRFFLARKILLVTNKLNNIYNQLTKMMTIKYTFIARNFILTHSMLNLYQNLAVYLMVVSDISLLKMKRRSENEKEKLRNSVNFQRFINGFASTSCPLGG